MKVAFVSAFLSMVGILFLAGSAASGAPDRSATPPSPTQERQTLTSAAIRKQMQWKLEQTHWDFGTPLPLEPFLSATPEELDRLVGAEEPAKAERHRIALHRTVEALILQGDDLSRKRAVEILNKLVEIHDPGDFQSIVTIHGLEFAGFQRRQESGDKVYEVTPPNPQRPAVLNIRELAYEHAALYLLTGSPEPAARARDILLRFAEVAGSWPLYDRQNRPHDQDESAYLKNGTANGWWGVWHPLDLMASRSLLRAYDMIRPTLQPEEKKMIEENFFVHQKELNDRFSRHRELYTNLQGYRLPSLILFGRVLNRPAYVHEAVTYLRELLHYSYTVDGFWKEVTPGYHRQITSRLIGGCSLVTHDYSDPPGYLDAVDGTRFDRLDLQKRFGVEFERMKKGLQVLAMPDGTYVSLRDSWPKKDKVDPGETSPPDAPGLLGVGGVAKLGARGMVAFLSFGGRRGHDQDDALSLVWFAGGREVFSETGYQALPGSGSSRKWHTISASHNTVTVNEHMDLLAPERLPDELSVPVADTPEAEGKALTGMLPAAAQYANQGRLLVWHAESDTVQAMEAEREAAYPGVTSLFRRTLVMIPEGDGDGILVDIFRIRGGKTHDYSIRGGLDEPYIMKFNAALQPAEGTLYQYVQLRESAEIRPPLLATARYPDGYEVRSRLGGVFGSPGARLRLLTGDGPAIRRLGTAPFSYVRHERTGADTGEGLESCYVWVHEAGREGKIRSVKAEADGGKVVVTLEREDRTDLVFSGENDESRFAVGGWTFTGRLAMASTTPAGPDGTVFSGGQLEKNGSVMAAASPSLTGSVIATTRRDGGADSDSLLVKLEGDASIEGLRPRLVHIDFGTFIRFSIPVEKATREGDAVRLKLAHSPGFDLADGKATMSHSPGWAYSAIPTLRIDCETIVTP